MNNKLAGDQNWKQYENLRTHQKNHREQIKKEQAQETRRKTDKPTNHTSLNTDWTNEGMRFRWRDTGIRAVLTRLMWDRCWGENQGGEELRNTREREVESVERLKLPNKTGNKETKNQKQDVRLEVIYQHRTSGNKSTKPEQKSALTLYITSLLQFWGTCFTKYESTNQLHVVMSILYSNILNMCTSGVR